MLTVPNVTGSVGQTVTIKATLSLKTNGAGVAGETISFQVNNGTVVTSKTNSSGVASVSSKIPTGMKKGKYTIKATFSGDANYKSSQGSGTLTVD